jgi:hypothetical protein
VHLIEPKQLNPGYLRFFGPHGHNGFPEAGYYSSKRAMQMGFPVKSFFSRYAPSKEFGTHGVRTHTRKTLSAGSPNTKSIAYFAANNTVPTVSPRPKSIKMVFYLEKDRMDIFPDGYHSPLWC